MAANLEAKLGDREFRTDIDAMIRVGAPVYDPTAAGDLVSSELLARIG